MTPTLNTQLDNKDILSWLNEKSISADAASKSSSKLNEKIMAANEDFEIASMMDFNPMMEKLNVLDKLANSSLKQDQQSTVRNRRRPS